MLRQYLVTAQDDLTNKQELVTIKQQRLSLAKDEFQHLNTTLTALHKEEREEQSGEVETSTYRKGQPGRPPRFS